MRSQEWSKIPETERTIIESYQNNGAVKLGALAKELGLEVKASSLPPGISGEIRPSERAGVKFTIRINRHEQKNRQRFTLAHEIAHALLHAEEINSIGGIRENVLFRSALSNPLEVEANKLAADILMPWSLIRPLLSQYAELGQEKQIEKVAETLGVSSTALKIRLGLV